MPFWYKSVLIFLRGKSAFENIGSILFLESNVVVSRFHVHHFSLRIIWRTRNVYAPYAESLIQSQWEYSINVINMLGSHRIKEKLITWLCSIFQWILIVINKLKFIPNEIINIFSLKVFLRHDNRIDQNFEMNSNFLFSSWIKISFDKYRIQSNFYRANGVLRLESNVSSSLKAALL